MTQPLSRVEFARCGATDGCVITYGFESAMKTHIFRYLSQTTSVLALLLLTGAPAGCALKLRSADQQRLTDISDSDAPATMKDQQGAAWYVNDIYRAGPAVVVFYRGHW